MSIVVAVVVLAVAALLVLLLTAAWSRFIDPEEWRIDSGWAKRPRLAGVLDVVLRRFDPLRSFILLLVLTGVVLAFGVVPTVAVLLGEL